MSGDDGFLTRWARRKRGAAKPDGAKSEEAADAVAAKGSSAATPPEEALFDPASLPPIDSIGVGSDISAFLAPGVPAALTRAALRRAWSADPAIRDFIGLSENSWDFNAVGGVPGFGPISVDEVRRLLAQVTGEPPTENSGAHRRCSHRRLVKSRPGAEAAGPDCRKHSARSDTCG